MSLAVGWLGWAGLGWLGLAGWLAGLHGGCLIWFRLQVLAGVFQISAELRKSPG